LKNDANVPSKSNKQKKIESKKQIAESGYISQRHGSADPDPDPNVTDPQHWGNDGLGTLTSLAGSA
jgi:hypothetical protein